MSVETQIIGEHLAKSVAARAAALDVINARTPALSWWHLVLLLIVGAAIGWLGAHAGSNSVFIIGVAAEVGFLIAVTAFAECIRLRRRLDAALLLLHADAPR